MSKITTKVKNNRQASFIDIKAAIIIISVYIIALIIYRLLFR